MQKCYCIILNYNDAESTIRMIKSIIAYSVIEKIIVIDNKSSDDSYEKLLKYQNEKVAVYQSEKNGGYGYGNNLGVKVAKTKYSAKYALIINPDVYFDEDVVRELICIIENDTLCAVSSCVQLDSNGCMINGIAWKLPSYRQYVFGSLFIASKLIKGSSYTPDYFSNLHTAIVDCVPGSLLMVDVDKFQEIGGYDERMFLYCEETTLGAKTLEHNYYTIIDLDHSYIHSHSVSINRSIRSIVKQRKILYRSRMIYLENYLKVSPLKKIIARIVFKIAIMEEHVKQIIKK